MPLPTHVNEIVLDHLRNNVGEDPESLIYESMTGGSHLGASTFYDYWYPAREAANRPDLHFHGLRHFGATAFALSGATIKELQDRLGHTTANVAMRYQHTTGRSALLAAKMSEQFAEGESKNRSKKKGEGKGKDKNRAKNKDARRQD